MPARGGAAEVVAARSPAMCRFFVAVMRREMGRGFRAVRLARPGPPVLAADRPVVVYSNHPSWWDPAFYIVLSNHLFPEREGYGPMEAEALERYRFMKRIGIFGVEAGSRRGAATFLRTGAAILADPKRMLWVTAQGRFADPRARPLGLRPGVSRLLAMTPRAVAVPLAFEYPFWSEKRPEALARFGAPLEAEEAARPERLEAALERTMDALAEDAAARDPGRFADVLAGRAGIGGVYDAYRRASAALGGRRFRPEHQPERRVEGS